MIDTNQPKVSVNWRQPLLKPWGLSSEPLIWDYLPMVPSSYLRSTVRLDLKEALLSRMPAPSNGGKRARNGGQREVQIHQEEDR